MNEGLLERIAQERVSVTVHLSCRSWELAVESIGRSSVLIG